MILSTLAARLAAPSARRPGFERADFNDWAINTIREHNRDGRIRHAAVAGKPAPHPDIRALILEERARCKAAGLGPADLVPYLRLRRTGSKTRLHRGTRAAIFAVLVTRGLI